MSYRYLSILIHTSPTYVNLFLISLEEFYLKPFYPRRYPHIQRYKLGRYVGSTTPGRTVQGGPLTICRSACTPYRFSFTPFFPFTPIMVPFFVPARCDHFIFISPLFHPHLISLGRREVGPPLLPNIIHMPINFNP